MWVLDPTPDPSLTLVTCYPFSFLGAAPQRFIVRARLDEADPQAAADSEHTGSVGASGPRRLSSARHAHGQA